MPWVRESVWTIAFHPRSRPGTSRWLVNIQAMDLQAKDSGYSPSGRTFTMIITAGSVGEMNLEAGPTYAALIKSTEVMILRA